VQQIVKLSIYLSPFWRSPMPQGHFMLWHEQSTVPAPVAAKPRECLVSARFTALWLAQLLFYMSVSACDTTNKNVSHLLWLLSSVMEKFLECVLFNEVCPAFVKTRIGLVGQYIFACKVEVSINCEKQGIFPSRSFHEWIR